MIVKDLLKGFIYGVFGILPGLSGGTIAICTGDFDRLLDIFFNRDFNIKNIKFISSILTGSVLGIMFLSKILLSVFNRYTFQFKIVIVFINLFILYDFLKKSKLDIFKSLIAIIVSIIFLILFSNLNLNIFKCEFLIIIVCSFFYSLGKVVPGISSTPLLINVGIYKDLLIFYANPFLTILKKPFFWILFWIAFLFYSLFLIKIIYELKDSTLFYIFLVIVQIISILLLLK